MISNVKGKMEISPNLQGILILHIRNLPLGSGGEGPFREWTLKNALRRNGPSPERIHACLIPCGFYSRSAGI